MAAILSFDSFLLSPKTSFWIDVKSRTFNHNSSGLFRTPGGLVENDSGTGPDGTKGGS